jgi:hypothetical protein
MINTIIACLICDETLIHSPLVRWLVGWVAWLGKWSTQTCVLGWSVKGVADPLRDGADVRAVDASPDRSLLVAADDFGYLTLFR